MGRSVRPRGHDGSALPRILFRLCRQCHEAGEVFRRELRAESCQEGIYAEVAEILVDITHRWREHDRSRSRLR